MTEHDELLDELDEHGDIQLEADEGAVATRLRELQPNELPEPGLHFVVFEKKELPVMRRVNRTEAQHVRIAFLETVEYIKLNNIRDRRLNDKGVYVDIGSANRLEKASENARWRYRGFLAGEIASL